VREIPRQSWDELRTRGFRREIRSDPGLFDLGTVSGREPTVPEPAEEYPAGWTVQNGQGRFPAIPLLVCAVCGKADDALVHSCPVLAVLSTPR